jgi:hypothetical protein
MLHLSFWRVASSGVWCGVVQQKFTDVSEEHTDSIFIIEELFYDFLLFLADYLRGLLFDTLPG